MAVQANIGTISLLHVIAFIWISAISHAIEQAPSPISPDAKNGKRVESADGEKLRRQCADEVAKSCLAPYRQDGIAYLGGPLEIISASSDEVEMESSWANRNGRRYSYVIGSGAASRAEQRIDVIAASIAEMPAADAPSSVGAAITMDERSRAIMNSLSAPEQEEISGLVKRAILVSHGKDAILRRLDVSKTQNMFFREEVFCYINAFVRRTNDSIIVVCSPLLRSNCASKARDQRYLFYQGDFTLDDSGRACAFMGVQSYYGWRLEEYLPSATHFELTKAPDSKPERTPLLYLDDGVSTQSVLRLTRSLPTPGPFGACVMHFQNAGKQCMDFVCVPISQMPPGEAVLLQKVADGWKIRGRAILESMSGFEQFDDYLFLFPLLQKPSEGAVRRFLLEKGIKEPSDQSELTPLVSMALRLRNFDRNYLYVWYGEPEKNQVFFRSRNRSISFVKKASRWSIEAIWDSF